MPPRDPKIVGSIDVYFIEEFPETGEPAGEDYLLILNDDGDHCCGHRSGDQWISDGGDPVTPIYWARKFRIC